MQWSSSWKKFQFHPVKMTFSLFPQLVSALLSPLPPCIIPLVMCQCNFGVQDVSSPKRMCFFFFSCALFKHPSTPYCYSRTFFYSFLFLEHVTAFRLYHHCEPLLASQLCLSLCVGCFSFIVPTLCNYSFEKHVALSRFRSICDMFFLNCTY